MKDNDMKRQKVSVIDRTGFTLIELMLVVAIIATLVTIALPMFQHYRVKSNNSAALSDLKSFKTIMEAEFNDRQSYPQF
jgi:type IV pilus assembly protein PilA